MILIRKSWWAAMALAALIVGCDTPAPPSPVAPPGPSEPKGKPAEPAKKVEIKDIKLDDKEIAQIKKLPEADQKLALEQKGCPITGEPLGSMGMPIKVMLNEQPVFLCCGGCKDDATADPKATLAKLGKK